MSEENESAKKGFFNKKITFLGKQIPLILILGLLVAGIGSAALITMYGQIIGKAYVEQAIILTGTDCNNNICTYTMGDSPIYDGETDTHTVTIENRANRQVPIKFVTTIEECAGSGYANCWAASACADVRYYSVLELDNKNTSWDIIEGDGISATLKYDLVAETFTGILTTSGLTETAQYALIYKPDTADRFADWNGAGGIVIATFTGNQDNLVINEELNTNLPSGSDWNANPSPNYCDNHNTFDDYDLCGGAKMWIVPTSDLTGGNNLPLIAWNPSKYLFETDMIDYTDGAAGSPFKLNEGKLDVSIETTFGACTGYYKITTDVEPA